MKEGKVRSRTLRENRRIGGLGSAKKKKKSMLSRGPRTGEGRCSERNLRVHTIFSQQTKKASTKTKMTYKEGDRNVQTALKSTDI